MAKSKRTTVPAINSPNTGMMAWLNQQTNTADTSDKGTPASEPESKSNLGAEGKTDEQEASSVVTVQQLPAEQGENNLVKSDVAIIGEEGTNPPVVDPASEVQPVARKPRGKANVESKGGGYPETFFKKRVKSETETSVGEVKPVRISEESHWLLSVLTSEARRQGHKINVGDLVDNLLEHHRSVYKNEVDELIANWKSRKRFD